VSGRHHHLLAAAASVALLLLALPCRAGTPEEDLTEGGRAYDRGEYRAAIELLRPLIYPRITLASQDEALRARKLLGLSYLFEQDKEEAERQFLAILAARPNFQLDPLVDPASAVELFEEVKRRNAERLERIRQRQRQEELRRQQQEALKRDAESEEARLCRTHKLVRTVVRRNFWINLAPLGAGQFQNGHHNKGFVLLGMQLGLGALSLGTYLGQRFGYPDGTYNSGESATAQGLRYTQIVAGGAALGLVAYGIIDAIVHYEAETVTERWIERKPDRGGDSKKKTKSNKTGSRLLLAPAVGQHGAGLNLGFSF